MADRRVVWAAEAQMFVRFARGIHPRVPIDSVLERAGLGDLLAREREDHVPLTRVWQLWRDVVEATGDRGLPARYGMTTRFEDFGLYGFALMTSATIREALERSIRYLGLVTNSAWMEPIEDGDELVLRWHRDGARRGGHDLANETVLAQWAGLVSKLHPGAVRRVAFRHQAPAAPSKVASWFPARVRWGSAHDEVAISLDRLDARLPGANPALSDYFLARVREAETSAATDLASQVRSVVARTVADQKPAAGAIARQLGMSERTLRRGLASAGLSFRSLADEVRRSRAELLLADPRLSLTEVAFALGFSAQSAFTRAFRRWFGVAPRVYRRPRAVAAAG